MSRRVGKKRTAKGSAGLCKCGDGRGPRSRLREVGLEDGFKDALLAGSISRGRHDGGCEGACMAGWDTLGLSLLGDCFDLKLGRCVVA